MWPIALRKGNEVRVESRPGPAATCLRLHPRHPSPEGGQFLVPKVLMLMTETPSPPHSFSVSQLEDKRLKWGREWLPAEDARQLKNLQGHF